MNLTVDADHPALPGHFPGRPIVPGVVLIARIVQALGKELPDLKCCGLRHVKFKRAVAPGVDLSLEWGAVREDSLTVRVQGADKAVYVEARLIVERGAADDPS